MRSHNVAGKPTSITILANNRGFAEWREIFGDPVVVTTRLDHHLRHAVVVQIEGGSYRPSFLHRSHPRACSSQSTHHTTAQTTETTKKIGNFKRKLIEHSHSKGKASSVGKWHFFRLAATRDKIDKVRVACRMSGDATFMMLK